MSQINANFQEIIANNSNNNNQSNSLDNVTGTAIISSEALQGFSMANQFAICANSGNGPVLLSCLTPMLLPALTGNKGSFELTGDGRGQNQPQTVQIQLASPFNLAGNLCNPNNAQSLPSLGLSYINLSQLTNSGNTFPLQITLNNPNNNNNGTHQLTIPAGALNSLNQEVQVRQLAQNYQISSQVKFEADLNVSAVQQQQQQNQQLTIVNRVQDISAADNDDKTKRKPRRRIPNKSNKTLAMNNGNENNNLSTQATSNSEERLLDHKGRPFIYNCPNCPKKFTLNSRLTAHLRCHTGIRPYTCVQCGFSFTQKSYLIRHAAVHTEERPFTCERCLKTYKHYGSLANHRKLHRKEDKNGTTSEISDSAEQKPPLCDNNNMVSTTTTIVDQSSFDNILQLHSDWSTVASSLDNNNTATYLITNATADNHTAYYTESSNVNVSHVLSGTGPVAFPDQQLTQSMDSIVVASNQSLMEGFCASNQQQQQQSRDNDVNHLNQSNAQSVFMDLQMMPSSSNHQQNFNGGNDNTLLYTHVEMTSDPSMQVQSQSQNIQSQQQQTYTTTFSSTNNV